MTAAIPHRSVAQQAERTIMRAGVRSGETVQVPPVAPITTVTLREALAELRAADGPLTPRQRRLLLAVNDLCHGLALVEGHRDRLPFSLSMPLHVRLGKEEAS